MNVRNIALQRFGGRDGASGGMSRESSRSKSAPGTDKRDRPWLMRTYAGHSTAAASNRLYRRNLEKGQTGLSVAFDPLPPNRCNAMFLTFITKDYFALIL